MPLPASYINPAGAQPWVRGNEEVQGFGTLVRDKFTNASTINAQKFVANHAGPNATTRDMTLAATSQTLARALIITVTHGTSVVACSGTIFGKDVRGKDIQENWSVTAGGTSKTYTTGKAFRTVSRITETAAGDASTNTIGVGDSKVFGLSMKCKNITIFAELQDGARPATAGTLVAAAVGSDTVKDFNGTYTPNGTPNGAIDWEVYYLVQDNVGLN